MTAEAATAGKTWTILELLRWTTGHFESRGIDTARLDAECLLAHVLGVDRLRLYVDFEAPVSPKERAAYRELVRSRADERVPVALLVGHKEFWSLRFKVTPDVLVPRPDTETLVAAALDLLPANGRAARVLDVGTGSGAVAVAIAAERPTAQLVATDISQAALEIARENADENGVGDRITWAQGDLFAPVAGHHFDLIVSNPPYVAEKQRRELAPELAHEPSGALFAGEEGTEVLYALIDGAAEMLAPGGAIALELDSNQAEGVARRLGDVGFGEISVRRDLAQRPRVVSARRGDG